MKLYNINQECIIKRNNKNGLVVGVCIRENMNVQYEISYELNDDIVSRWFYAFELTFTELPELVLSNGADWE